VAAVPALEPWAHPAAIANPSANNVNFMIRSFSFRGSTAFDGHYRRPREKFLRVPKNIL